MDKDKNVQKEAYKDKNPIIADIERDVNDTMTKVATRDLETAKDNLKLAQELTKRFHYWSKYYLARMTLLEAQTGHRKIRKKAYDIISLMANCDPKLSSNRLVEAGDVKEKHAFLIQCLKNDKKGLVASRDLMTVWLTHKKLSKKIDSSRVEAIYRKHPQYIKVLKDAEATYMKYKPFMKSKKNFTYTFNAMKLIEHYNEYGDLKHPDAKSNDRFKPITVKDQAINNMYWLAYDWYNLPLFIKAFKHDGSKHSLEQVKGYMHLVKARYRSITTKDYIKSPITPGTDPNIYKNND